MFIDTIYQQQVLKVKVPFLKDLIKNYPNPFNPTTTLSFAIAHRSFVSLKIYDVLGKEVATLINEERTPGEYEKEFNTAEISQTTSLPSGIYFYQLQAGDPHTGLEQVFLKTMKMLLIK